MPVNKKLMHELKKEYGEEKGEHVYYAMEHEHKVGHHHSESHEHEMREHEGHPSRTGFNGMLRGINEHNVKFRRLTDM